MGYNLCLITRHGRAASDEFSREDWDRLRATTMIPDWVYFEDGTIIVKSPSEE